MHDKLCANLDHLTALAFTMLLKNPLILLFTLLTIVSCGGSGGGSSSRDTDTNSSPDPEVSPANCLPDLISFQPPASFPSIELLGEKIVRLQVGETYLDAGANASDLEDGDLSSAIEINGVENIDTSKAGDYFIRYTVKDSSGHSALSTYRLVRVGDGDEQAFFSQRYFSEVDAPWEYFERLPSNAGDMPDTLYPLLIINHGWSHSKRFDINGRAMSGMNGQSVVSMLQSKRWDPNLPFIVLVPQRCWSDFGKPQVDILNNFVEWALHNYPVDPKRVYMSGLSMGGWATWEYLLHYHDILAAAAPMSGGGQANQACNFDDIPTWAFTAHNDSTVPYTDVTNTADSAQLCSNRESEMKVTVFSSGGHVIDDNVFDLSFLNGGMAGYDVYNQSIFEWLLEQEK